jgi:Fe-S protein assembly co-chaperone HscB
MTINNHSLLSPFELLSMEPNYLVDTDVIHKNYLILQETLHPDQYPKGAPEVSVAAELLEKINQAYGILKDPLLRGKAILEVLGFDVPGNQGTTISSPDLMEEAMELKEALAEAQREDSKQELFQKLTIRKTELEKAFQRFFQDHNGPAMQKTYVQLSFVIKTLKDIV